MSTPADDIPFATTLEVRDACLCLHLQRAARAVARRFDAAFRPLGLTSGQFSLLMSLNRPDPPMIGAVAHLLAMDRTTLTAALKPLERRGLVQVSVDPADRREPPPGAHLGRPRSPRRRGSGLAGYPCRHRRPSARRRPRDAARRSARALVGCSYNSRVRRAIASSQRLARSSSKISLGSSGAVNQSWRASSASSWPAAQPA